MFPLDWITRPQIVWGPEIWPVNYRAEFPLIKSMAFIYFHYEVSSYAIKCRMKQAIDDTTLGERRQDSRTVFFCFN